MKPTPPDHILQAKERLLPLLIECVEILKDAPCTGLRATVQVEEDDGSIQLWQVAFRGSLAPTQQAEFTMTIIT